MTSRNWLHSHCNYLNVLQSRVTIGNNIFGKKKFTFKTLMKLCKIEHLDNHEGWKS